MTMLDHDPVEARLRNALHRIVQDDLGDRPVTPLRPASWKGRSSKKRTWVRPATIAAALVGVAGIVALALALRDDDHGDTVILDDGDSGPVYVIPGPPLDTTVPSSFRVRTTAELVGTGDPHAYWGREQDGRIAALV